MLNNHYQHTTMTGSLPVVGLLYSRDHNSKSH